MMLGARVKKLEAVAGTGFAPSERDLAKAEELLKRHAKISVAHIFADVFGGVPDLDENDAALMMIAEKSGQIEAAKETKRRYWRVRGVDIDQREQEYIDASMARLRELFGDVEEVTP
jgi:hypothetical protein